MTIKLNIEPYHQRTCWIYDSEDNMIGRCNNYVEFTRARIEIVEKGLENCKLVFDKDGETVTMEINKYGKPLDWDKVNIYEPDYKELGRYLGIVARKRSSEKQ